VNDHLLPVKPATYDYKVKYGDLRDVIRLAFCRDGAYLSDLFANLYGVEAGAIMEVRAQRFEWAVGDKQDTRERNRLADRAQDHYDGKQWRLGLTEAMSLLATYGVIPAGTYLIYY
jgi:hypothetical protein